MKCSIFIATSADGYIATEDGGVEWLESAGAPDVDMGEHADMGFSSYIAEVDCMIMGRKCMEKISSFNLTAEQWPYGNLRIIALSGTVEVPPANLKNKVKMFSGDIGALLTELENAGFRHAYIDGGATITSFLNLGLIEEMIITRAPVLLGGGRPLFGKTNKHITLGNARATAYPSNFIQVRYTVSYQ
jgi:dihydrofolate reductase